MADYTDYDKVVEMLGKAQDVETDNREAAREAHNFVDKRDGQWEPEIVSAMTGRPRYTFDKVNPIIDQITGEIDQADFDIRIRPGGGEATKETAAVYDGIIRSIERSSSAQHIYSQGGRAAVTAGIGGWMVVQDWADADSFDQDLFIRPLSNFEDRVFFDEGAEMQDASDANHVFVLTPMAESRYKEIWPDGSGMSVSKGNLSDVYYYKKEEVVVGQVFYKKPITKELIQFSDGSVREANDDIKLVMDELAAAGITETKRRKRKSHKIMSRLFDGKEWLNDEQETVFSELPVIPVYANFRIREGKVLYRGAVEKMIDPQRVYNYTRSREVEEVALAPRAKYWMTRKQAQGNETQLATLNTNADPVQFYTVDPDAPPPAQMGGAQLNQGLLTAAQSASSDLQEAAGIFGLNQGRVDGGPLSGVAIQSLQNKGDNSTIKYFKAMEVAITATAKVLVKAIPKVYDTARQVRILNEDGSQEIMSVNDRVFDQQTNRWVVVNDLSKGTYDVTCDVGPAFKNRQQEAVKALTELMGTIGAVGELGGDVLLKNINSPGVDVVAERLRMQMVNNGLIPESQLTDEEKQRIQQAQMMAQMQPQEPTAEDQIAMAEIERVKAETADVISKAQERQAKSDFKVMELDLEQQKIDDKRSMNELTLVMKQQMQQMSQQQAMIEASIKGQQAMFEALNQQASTLKLLREAMGADAVIGPDVAEAYQNQAGMITEQQENLSTTIEIEEGEPVDRM